MFFYDPIKWIKLIGHRYLLRRANYEYSILKIRLRVFEN
jgi:hypothetical protein